MLAGGACAPRVDFDEGWRYIMMGSEHTWDFENPWEPYFHEAIGKVKQSYFQEAEARVPMALLDEALGLATDKCQRSVGAARRAIERAVSLCSTRSRGRTAGW